MFRVNGRFLPLVCLLAAGGRAQEPVRIPYDCPESELQSAGLLCTEQEPCPIYLEINAIAPAGRMILLAGDLHAESATLTSILLASNDGGATWKEPAPRIAGAAIDQLQVYDREHAWAAGEIQYPLSRDPFFLLTTDGGVSWRRRNVADEGGPGSVIRFWFDGPTHGQLIVDAGRSAEGGRYDLYESETGGESWMIRSATDAQPRLRLAPPSAENPDYRVRAADGGKTYEIEMRDDARWRRMASLLIEVGSCKLKTPELKEPQAPATDDAEPKDYVEEIKLGAPTTQTPGPPKKKGPPD
ncbi:MAG TPA: hypothetical protein VKB79_05455 [Bryobacteraceae bacterium]|nr:hypothetical protein [Bryobacteraceae bacterium]